MKKLFTLCLLAVTMCAVAQEQNQSKRIAILETVDKEGSVPYGIKLQLRQSITFAIAHTLGYEAYNRVDMSSISKEHDFQRTGMVSDADIRKLGAMTGASYVLIAEAAPYDDSHIIVSANLVNVESAQVENATFPIVSQKDPEAMTESCKKIAKILLNVSGTPSSTSSRPSYSYSSLGTHADFTETAWDINMKMVWVDGGEFLMGCTSEQGNNCYDNEKNVRRVTLDGYWIGVYEVTQSQWDAVVGTSINQQKSKAVGNNTSGVGANYPMYYVNWEEAMEFCRILSQKTGKTYTLPTEAQWEYAARGGIKSLAYLYSGSNDINDVAWCLDNSNSTPHLVGTKRPNELGLYDMSGNVYEWCKDWLSSQYSNNDVHNPIGSSVGAKRVNRGGSWYFSAERCRISYRGGNASGDRLDNLGFRVVCIP